MTLFKNLSQDKSVNKVLIIHSGAKMAGVEFSTLFLLSQLKNTRWKVELFSPQEGDLTEKCRQMGIHVIVHRLPALRTTSYPVPGSNTWRVPNPTAFLSNSAIVPIAAWKLHRVINERTPDLIVTKGMSAHIYGGLAARMAGVPSLWHLQDFISERYFGLYREFFALLARTIPTTIVADGAPIRDQMPRKIQNRVRVVLNGVDTKKFQPGRDGKGPEIRRQLAIPSDSLVVGNVARLTPWKGQHLLIEAFRRIAGDHPTTHLMLVGSSVFGGNEYEMSLRRLVSKLRLKDRVTFTGYRQDLVDLFQAMDIFAYSSVEKDTSPLSLLSAMASGLPVIGFDIPGIREVVGEQGLLVPAGRVEKLASSMAMLLGNTLERKRYAIEARRRAVSALSLEAHTEAMEDVFKECIHVGSR